MIALFGAARAREYRRIARAAEHLLEHLGREAEDRRPSCSEGERLRALQLWAAEVQARDYFAGREGQRVAELLGRCEAAAATYLAPFARSE